MWERVYDCARDEGDAKNMALALDKILSIDRKNADALLERIQYFEKKEAGKIV